MSDDWGRVARASAAREFGRRHCHWYALGRYRSILIGIPLAALAGAAVSATGWWLRTSPMVPVVLLAVASLAIVAGALRLSWLLSPRRTGSVRGSGGLGWFFTLAAVCVIGAALLS